MVKTNSGIYKITNFKNGKVYIGSSNDIDTRKEAHIRCLCNGRANPLLQMDFIDYGIDVFTFEVLENCEPDDLSERENYYIKQYNSSNSDYGYNIQKTSRRKVVKYSPIGKPNRSNQISLDFTNHLEAKKVYDELPHKNKTAWVSDAIIEKSEREKGNGYVTKEEVIEIVKEMMK
jgi:group I intron endonuclease